MQINVTDHQGTNGKSFYLVRWIGSDAREWVKSFPRKEAANRWAARLRKRCSRPKETVKPAAPAELEVLQYLVTQAEEIVLTHLDLNQWIPPINPDDPDHEELDQGCLYDPNYFVPISKFCYYHVSVTLDVAAALEEFGDRLANWDRAVKLTGEFRDDIAHLFKMKSYVTNEHHGVQDWADFQQDILKGAQEGWLPGWVIQEIVPEWCRKNGKAPISKLTSKVFHSWESLREFRQFCKFNPSLPRWSAERLSLARKLPSILSNTLEYAEPIGEEFGSDAYWITEQQYREIYEVMRKFNPNGIRQEAPTWMFARNRWRGDARLGTIAALVNEALHQDKKILFDA